LVGGMAKCFTSSSSSSEPYFFFPHLVSVECPQEVWRLDAQFDYQCGWLLWCSEAHHFFTARFLQVILLRLAFTFALNLQTQNQSNQPTVQRHCSVWKNGISWLNRDGIETLVEVRDQNKAAIVMMRCIEGAATKIEWKMHSSDAIFSWNKKTTLFGVISLVLQPFFSCKSVNLDIFQR